MPAITVNDPLLWCVGGLDKGSRVTHRFTRLICLFIVAVSLPACATVNMTEVAGASVQSEAPRDVNVVQRAVEKLKLAFTQRGFGPKVSKAKMQAAADVLMNGINSEAANETDGYNDVPRSPAIVTADILVAKRHVEQTTTAAEIYLDVAPRDRSLAAELASLEAALLVSEKACKTFSAALEDETAELTSLRSSVDELRQVTNAFGYRVRADRAETSLEVEG